MSPIFSDCPTFDASESNQALGDLVLRVHGGGYEEQTIRLSESKITVGSGPNCTLRLSDPDVNDLHCMILRGSDSTVVRSWNSRLTLDGREISDACLLSGTRLQVGNVRLHVRELYAGDLDGDPVLAGNSVTPEPHVDSAFAERRTCGHCETQLNDFEHRLASIERQLEQLSAALNGNPPRGTGCGAHCEPGTADALRLPAGDSNSRGLPLASLTEQAAYQAHPIDRHADGTSAAHVAVHRASDLPSWTEDYQDDDVDASVKEYVERLLQRVATGSGKRETGEAEVSAASPSEDRSPPRAEPSSILAALLPEQAPTAQIPSDPVQPAELPDEPYAPRSLPPERQTSLSEMREVANISAQAAIRSFEKSRATRQAIDRIPLMLVGLACGIALLYLASARGSGLAQVLLLAVAAVSLLASGGATWQAGSVLRHWMPRAATGHGQRDTPPFPEEGTETSEPETATDNAHAGVGKRGLAPSGRAV